MRRIANEVERLKASHSHRSLRAAQGRDFTSNDYLGFSRHPALRDAVARAMDGEEMVGAGGSRLLRGHHPLHAALEEKAAHVFGSEGALYFSSGFLANFALFGTLCDRRDAVLFDERIHASVKEGIHASHATRYRVRHNDPQAFEETMKRARANGAQDIWIAVESVYSMDGDRAPLGELAGLAKRYDATLVIDEAHATGVFGARGRGLSEGLAGDAIISLHTCGKALGVSGALICAQGATVEYLINRARPFIYSTAPPPMLAAAVSRALDLVDEEPWRRARLLQRAEFARATLRALLPAQEQMGDSQIIPIILGEDSRALAVAANLRDGGFDVRAIRPPTVAPGTARLRIAINAQHSEADIEALAKCLKSTLVPQSMAEFP